MKRYIKSDDQYTVKVNNGETVRVFDQLGSTPEIAAAKSLAELYRSLYGIDEDRSNKSYWLNSSFFKEVDVEDGDDLVRKYPGSIWIFVTDNAGEEYYFIAE